MALISRYFASKEGLFEACLEAAGAALRRAAGDVTEPPSGTDGPGRNAAPQPSARRKVAEAISRQAVGVGSGEGASHALLLLRAQVVLATAVGIAVLRASGGLEPLASTAHERLVGPVHDMVETVLW